MHMWQTLKQRNQERGAPFFCLAPMADVTDSAFRIMLTRYGKPDVMWTEFVSANGLMSEGRAVLSRDLAFTENERPIVAQLFSADPKMMRGAAALCATLGFDGIDINMGCPDKTIEKQGAGASMIKTPDVATAIIQAAKDGVKDVGKIIPISVKTRFGYSDIHITPWIEHLLRQDIAALTVHARTRKDLSKAPARWQYLKEVVALRDRLAPQTLIIGNGDVTSLADGRSKAEESGVDGVMVGRALFGTPWFFDASRAVVSTLPKKRSWIVRRIPLLSRIFETKRGAPESLVRPITTKERLEVMVEHAMLFETLLGDIKSFAIMKKHFKAYVHGFDGAKELRMALMETKNAQEVQQLVREFLTKI